MALGAIASLAGGRLVTGLLFGIRPHDPVTCITVVLMIAAVGLAACAVPALRAARVNPARAIVAD
ncbi:MAG: hypothetical protein L0271_08155 [Gemmatimonadetes bacterium]|nr:hypothetical protein [Gemmatimonadota bacterium]